VRDAVKPGARSATAAGRAGDRTVSVVRRVDCLHGPMAIAAITRLASKLGLAIQLQDVVIAGDDDAGASRCLGSPTVLVAGLDVEPDARRRTDFGAT
jgi:hypothetical protein